MYGTVMRKERKNITSAVRSAGRLAGRENRTGIPTQLKERMERSTGLSFDDVRVHYNSTLPARLDALAYTQGNQVEIAPGQERHLPHELGHVVQQKLGVVRANAMHSSGVAMNTDVGLERQADEIGAGKKLAIVQRMRNNVIQRVGGDKLVFNSKAKPRKKLHQQIVARGWTHRLVRWTVNHPFTTRKSTNGATGNSATVYYTRLGAHVIVDDVTREIVQVSNYNHPNRWIPDSRIKNPYMPYRRR